jgi:2,3-bisphosphoglycerate-independent phosphoglycerate mutase
MEIRQVTPGTSVSDYEKRADLVNDLVRQFDFVYVHLKGPDEPGHDGLFDLKKKRVEEIDAGFFRVLSEKSTGKYVRICVTCDHSTPWKIKGHSDDPVPVLLTVNNPAKSMSTQRFTEKDMVKGDVGNIWKGSLLIGKLNEIVDF